MTAELKDQNVVQLTTALLTAMPDCADALHLAAYAHDGQQRSAVRAGAVHQDPYIIHPIRLALRLLRWGVYDADPDQRRIAVTVALLHDVPEDAPDRMIAGLDLPESTAPHDALVLRFGPQVADAVQRLTNPPAALGATATERREQYRAHLRSEVAGDLLAAMVKSSDLVDNAGSVKHLADREKASRLADKYDGPVGDMIDALSAHLDDPSVSLDYSAVRGVHRARTRLAQVREELASRVSPA